MKVLIKSNSSSYFKNNVEKFCNNKLAVIGLIGIIIFISVTLFAPILTSFSPTEVDFKNANRPPDDTYFLGTDKLGRDVLSRILYGGRVSIMLGVLASLISSIVALILGGLAGYYGGKVDFILLRISELLQTFPQMILILLMVGIFGQSLSNLIIIFSLTGWMTTFRMVRNEFRFYREETFVQVCKCFGMSKHSIMFKQIVPNVISPVIVATTVNIAGFILSEAGLSFIGVGVPTNIPTWGNILNAAKSIDVISKNWWLWLFPGMAISIFVLAINFLGDGLRDVLDPKQQ